MTLLLTIYLAQALPSMIIFGFLAAQEAHNKGYHSWYLGIACLFLSFVPWLWIKSRPNRRLPV